MIKLLGSDMLKFDEEKHIYTFNGERIPSVTQVMSPLSAEAYGSIPTETLRKAAEKGTSVHEAIENYINYGIADIEKENEGYLNGFLNWFEMEKPEDCTAELRIYHPLLKYAGTCDLLCKINGKLTLIDHKTTSKVQNKLCCVQLEAYSQALKAHGIEIEDKIILHLGKDGTCEAIHFPAKDAKSWSVFGALMTVHNYKQGI